MKKTTVILAAIAAGAAIGALALYLASDKGKADKTRFMDGARKFSEEAESILADAKKKFSDMASEFCRDKMTAGKATEV